MCCPQEGYTVGPGIIWGVGGRGVPQFAPGHPILVLTMIGQGQCLEVRVALRSAELLADPLPVGVYPPPVFLRL